MGLTCKYYKATSHDGTSTSHFRRFHILLWEDQNHLSFLMTMSQEIAMYQIPTPCLQYVQPSHFCQFYRSNELKVHLINVLYSTLVNLYMLNTFLVLFIAVKSRPVLHHCVVIFFWSSGIMECTCMLLTFENVVLLMRQGASVV